MKLIMYFHVNLNFFKLFLNFKKRTYLFSISGVFSNSCVRTICFLSSQLNRSQAFLD